MNYPKRIFLADDDCDDVDFFTMAVKELSAELQLITACDGQELINTLQDADTAPDIIFIDINMPRVDGINALKVIRNELPAGKDVPIIMYSTSDDERFIRRAYEAGANCYFKKPFNFQELKGCISNFLIADWKKTVLPYEEFAVVV
jgi:CheY-like chemotaxis protein